MIWGTGPEDRTPWTTDTLCATPWRALHFSVRRSICETTSAGEECAMATAAKARVAKLRKETILTIERVGY